ncbi:MAG: energy-coupling factor ABC transporter permease [Holophagaceae bacterium]|nr:energy-coupling factor ABC transporter permease [Holophagaceae bacterium]
MHMADALISPTVGAVMCAASAVANGLAIKEVRRDDLCEKKIPIMAVMGAFVFAAQMINFAIPGTGSSGHIGGGILLVAMLGGYPALLSISAVLIIQCLFFADGGLLAIGCNIFNLGVVPCLIVYPLIFRPIIAKSMTSGRIAIATVVASVVGLQIGALCVVAETLLSGIANIPFSTFALLMQPIHLAIGIMEGVITAAVLCFVHKMRPEILESAFDRTAIISATPMRNSLIALAATALLVGGGLSLFVSSKPDGLEWAVEKSTGMAEPEAEGPIFERAAHIQESIAIMPDYNFKEAEGEGTGAGTALAGILGGAFTFLLAGATAFSISAMKKRHVNGAKPEIGATQ